MKAKVKRECVVDQHRYIQVSEPSPLQLGGSLAALGSRPAKPPRFICTNCGKVIELT